MSPKGTFIFTDGASRGNPGPGGWGAVLVLSSSVSSSGSQESCSTDQSQVIEIGGSSKQTTNNRMELTAALEALRQVIKQGETGVTVYTDSRYLINGITKWVHGWRRNDWRTKTGGQVLNRDLWEELLAATESLSVDWRYVSGHTGVVGNERADQIATAWADGRDPELRNCSLSKYPLNLFETQSAESRSTTNGFRSSRRSGRPYSYVSLVDGEIETHNSWPDCQARVHGVKGAKFKKVFSSQEEQELIKKWQGEN